MRLGNYLSCHRFHALFAMVKNPKKPTKKS
jgi:hypothetical protein